MKTKLITDVNMKENYNSKKEKKIFNHKICLYGLGCTGQVVANYLLQSDLKIEFIIDKNKAGTKFNDISVVSLEEAIKYNPEEFECIISLHNHYVDLLELFYQLKFLGFGKITSLISFKNLFPDFSLENPYWLEEKLDSVSLNEKIQATKSSLEDEKSKVVLETIVAYRTSGNFENYPRPSLTDEYTPRDLPRYKSPLNLIDCGAYTGVAVHRFKKAGYDVEKIIAFEPDYNNYHELLKYNPGAKLKILIPLATWSKSTTLRFSDNKQMGSKIHQHGESFVNTCTIDSIQSGFFPNLIKLDVEGAELETLLGAYNTIKEHRPNLCISIYHKPLDLFEICLLIKKWDLKYKFYIRVHEHNSFGVVLYCLQDQLVEDYKK